MTGHEKRICVKVFRDEEEAQIAQGLLNSNGIEAMVATEDADPARAGCVFGSGVELLVDKKDVEKAKKILGGKK